MKASFLFIATAMLWLSGTARAGDFTLTDIYYGAGISSNETDGFEDATGYQVFAGYDFGEIFGPLSTVVEIGYMDSGEFEHQLSTASGDARLITEAKGPWASGHLAYAFTDAIEVLGRAGYDFGDDDGALLGAGIGYHISKRFTLRLEYVARDVTDSLQLNMVYRPGR